MTQAIPPDPPPGSRPALRRHLLAQRAAFVDRPEADSAAAALARHLVAAVARLQPRRLGLYWPMRSEFNAVAAIASGLQRSDLALALPFTRRNPREMHYRSWDGNPPVGVDECRIPTSDGDRVVPDVVLAPCVGFTVDGYRLGYGGGYFDRWLALHPDVAAIGVAWSVGRLGDDDYAAEPHDRRLTTIVTELGIF